MISGTGPEFLPDAHFPVSAPTNDMAEPTAVIGTGFRLPGGANTPSELWSLLQNPRDLLTAIPTSRFNARGFYHSNDQYHGHCNITHSYLLSDDNTHRCFDAKFFNIHPAEAAVMDPQIRLLLEVVYEALESSGLPFQNLRGSDTAVYAGLMMSDYERLMLRDEDSIGQYHVTGTTRSLVANRLSYFFDWHGPSITLDTACSSSLVAVHYAVQQLRSGQSRTAIAVGTNLLLDPQYYVSESKLHMLSPDSRSRMWDAAANGYARGEGVTAVVLKKLSDAEADGDSIECVIRETGVNQDGRTQGITMPSALAQARLIRECYQRAGLDLTSARDRPQYFEAHGTGTPAGDPIEAEAISLALPPIEGNILYVGSIKTIMGHAEGAAGLAALIKTSLALKNATIPPNMLLDRLNPKVAPFSQNLKVLTSAEPWPTTMSDSPLRASVNSFGFGGTNAHAILESYRPASCKQLDHFSGQGVISQIDSPQADQAFLPFVISAASEASLVEYLVKFQAWLRNNVSSIDPRDLAYTLCSKRLHHPVSVSFAAQSAQALLGEIEQKLQTSCSETIAVGYRVPHHLGSTPSRRQQKVLGIFTGQGATWPGMGAGLVAKSVVMQRMIQRLETQLSTLSESERPSWFLSDELQRFDSSAPDSAALSQPLCTALQILQVELIRASGISFTAVVGHSSGEIAAAYAAGMLSAEEAIIIAYQRGLKYSLAQSVNGKSGSMMAVGASFDDVQALCDEPEMKGRVCVAAVNSPASVTVSGDTDAIREMELIFQDEQKFVRVLRVDKAYHSHHMIPCSKPYQESLDALKISAKEESICSWYSSVLAGRRMNDTADVPDGKLGAEYWVQNMVQPVLFEQAVRQAWSSEGPFDIAIEVGPHPALKGPTLQTLGEVSHNELLYCGLSIRGQDSTQSFATALGYIWTHLGAGSIDLEAYQRIFGNDSTAPVLAKGLPNYAWDHEVEHWHESRLARTVRTRTDRAHELLGHLQPDSTGQDMRWRNILRPQEIDWLAGHRLQGQIVFPAAGYVVIAIEAAIVLSRQAPISIIEITDLDFVKALTLDHEDSSIETLFSVSDMTSAHHGFTARFKYHAAGWNDDGPLHLLAQGCMQIYLGQPRHDFLPARPSSPPNLMPVRSDAFYESLQSAEYEYHGPFVALRDMKRKAGVALGGISVHQRTDMLIHPATLDAAFQSVLLAHSFPSDGRLWSMHVPKTIQSVRINPELCLQSRTQGGTLSFDAVQDPDTEAMKGDVHLYTEEGSHAMIQVEGLLCVPFSRAADQADTCLFSETLYCPMSPDVGLVVYDGRPTVPERQLVHLLERTAGFYLRTLDREVPSNHPSRTTGPLTAYYHFAAHASASGGTAGSRFWAPEWQFDTHEIIAALCEPHEQVVDFKLLRAIGENIVAIATGAKQAIEVGMEGDLLAQYYQHAIGMSVYTKYLARTVRQIVHRFPHMKILEIGAGTGGATRGILAEIGQSFASYTFTDVSSGFFTTARSAFSNVAHKMSFQVLDISRDPREQGFLEAEHSYDLIVASMVLHATPRLNQTLRNVRRLLKPGGRLVVLEGHDTDSLRVGAIFGAFPGWWLGQEDGRILSPCVDQVRWDELLRNAGFSGCDTVSPDPDRLIMPLTLFVSQSLDDRVTFLREPLSFNSGDCAHLLPDLGKQNLVLLGGATLRTSRILLNLQALMKPLFRKMDVFRSLVEVPTSLQLGPTTTILSTLDLDTPVFSNMTATTWRTIKGLLTQAGVVLWVTNSHPRGNSPYANMMKGILRCCTRESPSLDCQILEIETVEALDARIVANTLLSLQATIVWQRQSPSQPLISSVEDELRLNENLDVFIPRLVPSHDMNLRYNSARHPVARARVLDGPGLVRLDMTASTLCLRYEIPSLCDNDVGKLVRVTHSNLAALKVCQTGYLYLLFGQEQVSGQQVAILSSKNSRLGRAWNDVGYDAAITPNQEVGFTQHVSQHLVILNIVEGLSQGDQILVHEPDIQFAAAVMVQAQALSLRVLFTTESPDVAMINGWIHIQAFCLDRTLKIALPSPIAAFLDMSMQERSRLVGQRIRDTLRPSCQLYHLESLYSTESTTPSNSHADLVRQRLQLAVTYAQRSMPTDERSQNGVATVQISSLPRSSKDCDPLTIMTWESSATVQIIEEPVDSGPMFRASGTYWLVGLSGGLGLSLCEWMIRHGARNVVISSRQPEVDKRWLRQVSAQSANVQIVACDITDPQQVSAVYASICSTFPPVIGVAQGAMVLEDVLVSDMSFESLSKVLAPKVTGSLHLDNLFQENTLDFFVFFSSVAGVVGNPGQANYSSANSFMSGLAAQRRQRGLAASIINIGPVVGVGYIAQEDILAKTVHTLSKGYMGISERDFHQLFAEAVLSSPPDSGRPAEITTGLQHVQIDALAARAPGWAKIPRLSHFVLNSQSPPTQTPAGSVAIVPVKTRLAEAKSVSDVENVIRDAFLPKLCALFQLDPDSLLQEDLHAFRLDEAGIDSLLAVEIRSWFVKTLEVNIPVLRILNASVGELIALAGAAIAESSITIAVKPDVETNQSGNSSDRIELSDSTVASSVSQIAEAPQESALQRTYKLSFSQSMFWFVETALVDRTSLNHSGSFKMTGLLRPGQLATAVRKVGAQHEALRTCFFEDHGEGRQGVMDSSVLFLELRQIESEVEVEQQRLDLQAHVYDIRRGETMRIMLLSLSDSLHFLVMGAHGLVMDGLSFQVFISDLEQHYQSEGALADETRQFHEFAQQQHDDHTASRYDDSLQFWRKVYHTFPPAVPILRVSRALSRPVLEAYENERVDIRIDKATRTLIQEACRRHRVTAFHFFLSIFRTLIARHGGSDAEDVSIGVGDANRNDYDMTGSIGMFLNILPLRFHTQPSASFMSILNDTREKMYEALAHSEVPFQVVIDELEAPRSANCTPLFQCFIDYRQGQREKMSWADCQLEMLSFQASKTPYDISLDIIDNTDGECLLMFQVRKELYSYSEASNLASSYEHLIQTFAENQNLKLSQPSMFAHEDTKGLPEMCRGPSLTLSWPETVIHRIQDVARMWPYDSAVISDVGAGTTYTQLMNLVQQIATGLRDNGATRATRVAVLQEPTAYWVSSALAIMHIGAIYVPLDLSAPWSRLRSMMEDCEARILLVDRDTESQVPKLKHSQVISINVEGLDTAQQPYTRVAATADDTAMILYTSGSTGTPKGIELKHAGLANWLEPTSALHGLGRETVLQQSSSNFDMSFTQIATALCFGGAIYPLPRHLRGDASGISEIIACKNISYTCATPSEYSSWLRYGSSQLLQNSKWRTAISAGEPVKKSLLGQFAALEKHDLRLFNMYGPTEISLTATAAEVPYREHTHDVAAGYVLPNYSVYVVDEYLHLLPAGVQGEIYIGGAGVSPGYLNNYKLTAERFVPDIFAAEEDRLRGWRSMHRTGDVGRWDAKQRLLVEGRVTGDTQIKLRGLRVDLREIECAIVEESAGSIVEAVVSIRNWLQGSDDAAFLVAHVVFDHLGGVEAHERPQFLRELQSKLSLPQYMCPTLLLAVEQLPRTSSAKLDRRAVAEWVLPEDFLAVADVGHDSLTAFESQLKTLWAEVVHTTNPTWYTRVTENTDFFHVGGTSLSLVALQARILSSFDVKIPLVQMFRFSKLRAMAHRIEMNKLDVSRGQERLMDWDKETEIPPHIHQLLPVVLPRSTPDLGIPGKHGMVVVLTGSTGFLGQAILLAMMAEPSIQVVHCLAVRNANTRSDAVVARMRAMTKVQIHSGDLADPRLGLCEEVADNIFAAADTVIHNGADVSYLKGYDTLRPANVESTEELAALCLPRLVSFHYISTAGVSTFAAMEKSTGYEFAAESAAAFPPPAGVMMESTETDDFGHKYLAMTATKWASERFLERVVAEMSPSWPVYIHRPGLIVRPEGSGDPSGIVTDLAWNLGHYVQRLQAVPVIQSGPNGERSSGRLNLVVPDDVVQGVVQLSLTGLESTDRENPQYLHYLGGDELLLGEPESLGSFARERAQRSTAGTGTSATVSYRELPLKAWTLEATNAGMDPAVAALLTSLESSDDIVFPKISMH